MSVIVSSNYTATGTNFSYQTADDDLISGFRPIGQGVEEHDHTTTRGLGPQDDRVYSFGTSRDVASVLRSSVLAANTTLTNVIVGTPVVTAMPADSLITSHITANGDIVWLMNSNAGNSWEYLRFDASARLVVFNEASNDIDFRIESDNNANAFVVDAGLDAIGLGDAPDSATFLTINAAFAPAVGPAAAIYMPIDVTGVADTNINLIRITNNVLTEAASGTHARISAIDVTAPTVTGAGAAVTNTATIYISGAISATVTGRNKALWVDAGVSEFGGDITPDVSDGAALGTTSLMWSDLMLASGAVINFNAGNYTVTHSAGLLTTNGALTISGALAGATTIVASSSITAASVLASSDDSGALGASGTAFADLFLASGGVINFNAGNYTLTHSAGLLTTNGGLVIDYQGTGSAAALNIGNNGVTNPAFRVNVAASQATGLAIDGNAAGSRVGVSVISSGTNEGLDIDAKGSGSIRLGINSTGAIISNTAHTLSAGATITTGGLTVTAGGATITAGNLGIGGAPRTQEAIFVQTGLSLTGATDTYGVVSQPTHSSGSTGSGTALYGQLRSAAAAFTMTAGYGLYLSTAVKGAGSTITTVYGAYVAAQNVGGTNNYGVYIEAPSGGSGSNIGLYNAGTTSFQAKVLQKQGADVASTTNLVLGSDGNVFEITGTTKIDLISNLTWQNGSVITLIANESVVIDHGTATSGTNVQIRLAGAVDYSMTAGDTLTLVLSETTAEGQAWREISRAVI